MKLLDISDPFSDDEGGVEDNPSIAIGIDLGTTNSLIAVSLERSPRIISVGGKRVSVPSVVSYASGVTVGREIGAKGEVVIKSVKRLMGKNIADIASDDLLLHNLISTEEDNSKIVNLRVSDNKSVTPIEVSAEILKELRERAEDELKTVITKAVITVPAYFDDAARGATKQAAKLAGLEVLRLINEPTAAALAYGLDETFEGVYLVYDLGGGTFDVSILDMQQGIFKVLATAGDTKLGGDDFDSAVAADISVNYIGTEIARNFSVQEQYKLLSFARDIKESLSSNEEYTGEIVLSSGAYKVEYTRESLDLLLKPLIDKTFVILEQAIKDSKKSLSEIREVVLVGGSTKTPYVKARLAEYFAKTPLCKINPEQVVALGAALQAEALTKGVNNLLVDVVPLSLGIETMGGMVEKIIERNTPVPAHAYQEFTTYEDNQSGIVVHILQGERELVTQNRSLARFVLGNLPQMPAGKPRVRINFQIDRDGILIVSAHEMSSDVAQEIQVKPSFGLDEGRVLELLKESMVNAKSDMKERLVAKYKFEIAEQVKAIMHLVENEIEFFAQDQIRNAKEFAKKRLIFIDNQPEFEELQELHAGTKQYLDDLAVAKVASITKSLKGKNVAELNEFFKEKSN